MIAVTGATGRLGRLVVDALLDRGVESSKIVAVVRSPEKAVDLAARGVQVRKADYTEPETLDDAFTDIDRLLLISSSEVGQRFAHHKNVVDAARRSGIGFIAYTSITRADTNPMMLASEHRATEVLIRESGIPFAILRNGWYTENYTENLEQVLEHGALIGSAGEGRISAAPRVDYAAAAAAVMAGEGHEGKVYELGGDDAFTMKELAAAIEAQSDTAIVYRDIPVGDYAETLKGFGLPEPAAAVLADADGAIAGGALLVESGDLRRIIGRETTPLSDVLSYTLAAAE